MQKVLIIGSGKLAWNLAPNLLRAGLQPEIWARSSSELEWPVVIKPWPSEVAKKDFAAVFLATPDDSLEAVGQRLKGFISAATPVIHTSGASSLERIPDLFEHRGVLWPIRSLQIGAEETSWRRVPLVYEASNEDFKETLTAWVDRMSETVFYLGQDQRAQLHLAAVFGNNFTNWMCQLAYELCRREHLPFAALLPLIKENIAQLTDAPPALRQSGPAVRNDRKTMQSQRQLLEGSEALQELYALMSRLIAAGAGTQHTK